MSDWVVGLAAFCVGVVCIVVLVRDDTTFKPIIGCTDSMEPTITCRDKVTLETAFAPSNVGIGDVISFRSSSGCGQAEKVIHRVVDVKTAAGTFFYLTKGDANRAPDVCWVPAGDGRDVWAWEIIPTHRGVVAEPRVTEREIPVPMGVKARQAGGQEVTQQRRLRVDHDLDTRSTRAELVRTAKAVSRLMEADKAAPPKRTAKRGSRRDEKLKRSPLEMPEIVILNESPTMRRGW